jgi:hypothetical protein
MKKRSPVLSCIAIILAVTFLFSGCGGGKGIEPQSQISGYYSVSQSLSGGSDLKYINLKDIKINKTQTDTKITLEFMDGSLQMGMPEQATKGVPKYNTEWIKGLNRFVLDISGLIYWDYKVYEDELKDTPILGIFKQIPVDDTDKMLTKLYFNLKDNIAYKIEEKNNTLIITLRALPEDERSDYYVMVDAFEEYTDGKISPDEALYPTLCSDKTNVVLISKPFSTEAEANTFLDQKKKSILPSLPGKTAIVKQLKNNELPVYDSKGALDAYIKTPVTKIKTAESTAPVLLTNGRILCWKPDGSAYVFATPFFLDGDNGTEATTYEKIYMCEVGAKTPTLLSDFEYSSIQKAVFSDDGRYLAFLDNQEGKRSLYIYDTSDTKASQVSTAAESGFGEDTASFTWGSGTANHTIYGITGESDMLQLMAYELKDNQLPKVETLMESAFTEGSMGFYDGKVYYSQNSTDVSQNGIYCFDPANRSTVRISNGVDFSLNSKTGSMAILIERSVNDETYDMKIYNPTTKDGKIILQNKPVADTIWSDDGSVLYYTLFRSDAKKDDRYQYALNKYTMDSQESTYICDMVEGDLNPSNKNTEILLTCLFSQDNQYYIPITFRIAAAK